VTGSCDPGSAGDSCQACLLTACCAEWLACDGACETDFSCVQSCILSGGEATACSEQCTPVGRDISLAALNLISCSLGGEVGATAPCGECFGFGGVTPEP
jgi:hypothetical protein